MTREHKLALILGFALVMVVGVLVSDHISGSQRGVATTQSMDDPIRAIETELGPGLGQSARRSQDRSLPGLSAPEDDGVEVAVQRPGIIDNLVDGVRDGIVGWNSNPTPPAVKVDRPGIADSPEDPRNEDRWVPGEIEMGKRPQPGPIGTGPTEGSRGQLHRVEKGETLWSIAEKYYGDGNFYRQLQTHNADRIASNGTIQPGTNLIIPSRAELDGKPRTVDVAEVPTTPRSGSNDSTTGSPKTWVYVVKRGDVLGTIAQRELGTVKRIGEILKLNEDKISSADEIWVGLELRMPPR